MTDVTATPATANPPNRIAAMATATAPTRRGNKRKLPNAYTKPVTPTATPKADQASTGASPSVLPASTVVVAVTKKVRKKGKLHHCNTCSYTSNRSDNMRKHKLIHTDLRPEKCKICGAAFKDKSNCAAHERTVHSDARPHQCSDWSVVQQLSVCPFLLRCLTDLSIFSFLCASSNMAFKTRKALAQHAVRHTKGTPHACPGCPEGFKSRRTLVTHQQRVHSAAQLVAALQKENAELKKRLDELVSSLVLFLTAKS